jgi:hypothetical protein
MSINHLCDSRVVVYRTTPDRDEFGDTVDVWTALAVPAGLNARPNQDWLGNLQDPGPGERQAMLERWFLVLGFDIRERDVIKVESGPKVGLLYRVHSVDIQTNPHQPHHLQVNLEVWDGSVASVVEASS